MHQTIKLALFLFICGIFTGCTTQPGTAPTAVANISPLPAQTAVPNTPAPVSTVSPVAAATSAVASPTTGSTAATAAATSSAGNTPTSSNAATAVATAAATATTATANDPDVLIDYQRQGGFAGFNDHLIIYRNGKVVLTRRQSPTRIEFTIDQATLNSLVALMEQAKFSQLAADYTSSGPVADAFTYIITYQGHTVKTMDTAIPDALRPILAVLNQLITNAGA